MKLPASLHVVPPIKPASPYERARAEAKRHARETALETIAFASEAADRLRDLASLGDDLPVCVQHDAPLTAARLSADIARMLASLNHTGRIR